MGFCFIFSYKKESWGNAGPTSGQTVPALVWRWSNSGPTYVAFLGYDTKSLTGTTTPNPEQYRMDLHKSNQYLFDMPIFSSNVKNCHHIIKWSRFSLLQNRGGRPLSCSLTSRRLWLCPTGHCHWPNLVLDLYQWHPVRDIFENEIIRRWQCHLSHH